MSRFIPAVFLTLITAQSALAAATQPPAGSSTPVTATGGTTRTLGDWFSGVPLGPRLPGFSARLHLAKFAASSTPTVCLAGDSTSSLTANQIEQSELLWPLLTSKIAADNPTKTISFVNRAVPSQTWATLNGTAVSNWPSWYFNTGLPWLPYVQAANCTALFVNMGINDGAGISAQAIRGVLAKVATWGAAPASWVSGSVAVNAVITDSNGKLEIASNAGTTGATQPTWSTTQGGSTLDGTVTWFLLSSAAYVPKIPDVVLITNKIQNPAYNADPSGSLLAAAYQRTLTRNGGAYYGITGLPPLGLIDTGRYQAAAVLGFDTDNQYLAVNQTITSGTNEQFVSQTTNGTAGYGFKWPTAQYGDFGLSGTFYGRGNDMLTTGGSAWWIGLGTNTQNYIQITQSGANLGASITDYSGAFTGCAGSVVASQSGNIVWDVTAKGSHVMLTINGTTLCDLNVPRWQGAFQPWMQINGSPVGANVIATISAASAGVPMPTFPFLSATAWGGTGIGGNGNNHSSSLGVAAEDAAVFGAINFNTN